MFEKEPVKLTMGEVVTPYHTLKLGMVTERHRLEQVKDTQPESFFQMIPVYCPHRQEMKDEMKDNLIIFLLKHSLFTPAFWPFGPTSCFLLEALLPAGGGERLCDGEVGSENDGRVTGQNHRNSSGILTKELKYRMLNI